MMWTSLSCKDNLSMGDADADIPLLNRARIPIVVGGSSVRLRDGADPLHFAESLWDLKRLEERIVIAYALPI